MGDSYIVWPWWVKIYPFEISIKKIQIMRRKQKYCDKKLRKK